MKVVQSPEESAPFCEPLAVAIVRFGVVPPDEVSGALAVTVDTLLLKVFQSVEVRAPFCEVVAF